MQKYRLVSIYVNIYAFFLFFINCNSQKVTTQQIDYLMIEKKLFLRQNLKKCARFSHAFSHTPLGFFPNGAEWAWERRENLENDPPIVYLCTRS